MKYIKLLCLMAVFSLVSKITLAQNNNLQFNSVKYISLSCDGLGCIFDTTFLISEDKVWKIESGATDFEIHLNSNKIISHNTSGNTKLPIWLPSGTYTFRLRAGTGGSGKGFLSVIEFNIVP